MYLAQVLADIRKASAPPKNLHAEHLFKLNEAVFNLPEEDTVDTKIALRLFQTVEKIRTSYNSGKFDNADSNFFYDYLALLGTMQNQHFFSQKQTEKMLGWIKEIVDDTSMASTPSPPATNDGAKDLALENEKLRTRLAKYEQLQGAVQIIRSFDLEEKAKAKAKAKPEPSPAKGSPAKGKGKGTPEPVIPEPPPKNQKGKGKGKKGKGVQDDYEERAAPATGKGKGKDKGKGKGGKASVVEVEEERPPIRQGKGALPNGKGGKSSKGKGKEPVEEKPPLRAAKGKGKAAKGKGKEGESKGKGGGKESKWKAKTS